LGSNGVFNASFDLNSFDETNGFVINGINSENRSGFSVSGARDVNGDGIDDLIISAIGADFNGRFKIGQSYVVFGKNSEFIPIVWDISENFSWRLCHGLIIESVRE
jgi:FG-GAP repeat